ncbi:HNH endonuclease [Metabacillus malikii]|uniref:Uncharacterized protein n=1 Tax=Metabacillus malikii TaxID=1504265 RepID=A0ABT9ZNP3_9BACI|nr:HNH endonuclease [Metabacillus malikii]MDQ0233133.1 hypothetical protein [Metabacillus malikii]
MAEFGYTKQKGDKELKIHNGQAEVVKQLFQLEQNHRKWSLYRLAEALNDSVALARQFGMEPGGITAKDIYKYRTKNQLTWHEVNDVKIMQLVPTERNKRFGHLGE